jgi:integrase
MYRDVVPAIGQRKAKTIEREDIAEIINKIVLRGKIVQANRTLAACSRLFNWALSKGLVLYNPCAQMKKYEEKPRQRVLTEPEQRTGRLEKAGHAEIKSIWAQLTEEVAMEARILRLCFLTGARPGEVCQMRWEQIEERNWWTVKAEETKTGVELECYLTPTALAIIGEKPEDQIGYVFPMATNKDRHLPEGRLSKYVREHKSYFGLPPWQPRDLRRTFTTLTKGFGFTDVIVNKAQARKDGTVIRVHYDKRRYYEELRHLFESVEQELMRIFGQAPEPAKVIPLKG